MTNMNDKFITRLFALLIAFIIGMGFSLYCLALWEGRTVIPPSVVLATAAFVVAVLSAATPWVTSRINRQYISDLIQQSDKRTDTRIAQTEHKLLNGTGDSIAQRTADRVMEAQAATPNDHMLATQANTVAMQANTQQMQNQQATATAASDAVTATQVAATVQNTAATMVNTAHLDENTRAQSG